MSYSLSSEITFTGVATPGAFTCGAVESCSVKDFLKPPGPNDKKARVSLVETAARGLDEVSANCR